MNLIKTENELLEALYKLKCNDIIDWIKKCNSNKVVKIKHSEFGVKMMNIAKIYNFICWYWNLNFDNLNLATRSIINDSDWNDFIIKYEFNPE